MSGVEAFALACGIMQVISFSEQTFSVCRRILKTGTPDPSLSNRVQDLMGFCDVIERRCTPPTGSLTANEQKLLDITTRTMKAAKELKAEVDKICPSSARGKLSVAVIGTLKVLLHQRKLEKLEKAMMEAQKALENGLLADIWYVIVLPRPLSPMPNTRY
ncbi:hypothetical protein B0T21DRAFT_296654 [Apiosordaria backusii]|uniref:Uncharacterized protein n=1 Tax=Apiosordaria backusii TaxID=314023 RepID=A0AA40AIU2_9PEZI|nr:hypothetical protein B0T21DRAFT_296654 [Apiosordaria backusii]